MKVLLTAIYPYIFTLLYLIIPFDEYVRALPNILMGILIISFPFAVKRADFKKLVIQPTIALLFFFIYLLINSYFKGILKDDINIINKMMIPVGLVLLYLPVSDFKKLKKAIVFSSFVAIVFTIIQFVIAINNQAEVSLYFFQETVDALLIDRIYVGLLCILSILTSYQFLSKEYHPDNRYYLISIIINVIYLFIIMSKTAIVILIVLLFLKQFYGKKKKLKIGISISVLFLITIFGLINFKYVHNIIQNSKDNISEIEYTESSIPIPYRVIIWECASTILNENSTNYFGIGFKETTNRLVDCYKTKIKNPTTRQIFVSKRFNTHNQYLDFYLGSGSLSILLFLGIGAALFIQNRKEFFPTALLISMFLFGMVESFFHRQLGAYYFGFILAILFISYNQLKATND